MRCWSLPTIPSSSSGAGSRDVATVAGRLIPAVKSVQARSIGHATGASEAVDEQRLRKRLRVFYAVVAEGRMTQTIAAARGRSHCGRVQSGTQGSGTQGMERVDTDGG